jgi:hypothetical protein
MLNIPEKLLIALGFAKGNTSKNAGGDISKDPNILAKTASAKALLDALKGVHALANQENYESDNYSYRYYYSFATPYEKELGLTKIDTKYLDKIEFSENAFNRISYCKREVIRLFVAAMRNWLENISQKYRVDGSAYIEQFAELVAKKEHRYRSGSWNFRDTLRRVEKWLLTRLFQLSENAVRNAYNHGRQLAPRSSYTNKEVVHRLGELDKEMEELIAKHLYIIRPTSQEVEMELNGQNKSRWKVAFEQISNSLEADNIEAFVAKIMQLHEMNKENTSNSLIFLESAKFLASQEQHRLWALKMYVYYAYCEPKDSKLKTVSVKDKKIMLPNADALKFYANYIENQQFRAFSQVDFFKIIDTTFAAAIAPPSRKKIIIDHQAVADTKAAHSDTVALLNNILADEEAETTIAPAKISPKVETTKVETTKAETTKVKTPKTASTTNHKYKADLGLQEIQIELLELFGANNLSLDSAEIKQLAKVHKTTHNSLIDSINEICFELLDDVLIEEDSTNHYTINSSYFRQISHD